MLKVKFTLYIGPAKISQGKKRTFELNLEVIESQIKEIFTNYLESQAKNSSDGLCSVIDIQVPCSAIVIHSLTGDFNRIF